MDFSHTNLAHKKSVTLMADSRSHGFGKSRSMIRIDSMNPSRIYSSMDSLKANRKFSKQDRRHNCALTRHRSNGYLDVIPRTHSCSRFWSKLIVVSTLDHRTQFFYRSSASLELERRRHILYTKRIFHPFSLFRMIYEHWMLLVYLYSLVIIPVDLIAYSEGDENDSIIGRFTIYSDLFCLLDIMITFFTGIVLEDTKEIVLIQKRIAVAYLKSPYFYMDFISSLPSDGIAKLMDDPDTDNDNLAVRCIKFLSLVKIVRARTVFQRIANTAEMLHLSQNYVRLLKYNILSLLIVHWIGCLIFIIPSFYRKFQGIPHEHIAGTWYIYVDGIYKAVAYILCINTLTNEKNTPKHEFGYDMIVVIMSLVVSIFGKILVAVFIILFCQIFENVKSSSTKYQEIVNQLKNFMRHRQLPLDVQKRLLNYYEYRFQKTYFRESEITSFLSRNIMQQINLYCYRKLVERVSILRILPPESINEVIGKLKCEFFQPNDVIVKNGQTGDCLYFLASGTVSILTPSGKEICHLESGSYFGEIALVNSENKRTADVIAIETCEIYKLDRKSFKKLLVMNDSVAEKVRNLASVRQEQTKLIEEMHNKLIMTRMNQEHAKEFLAESKKSKATNMFGRPLNWKWNSKLWKDTVPIHKPDV